MASNLESRKAQYVRPHLIIYGSVRKLTGGSRADQSDTGIAGGKAGTSGGSDRSIKENIVEVSRHPFGFGIYLFDYKPEFRDTWGHGRQFGVMADEVELIVPEAVSRRDFGYAVVDYERLGISRH